MTNPIAEKEYFAALNALMDERYSVPPPPVVAMHSHNVAITPPRVPVVGQIAAMAPPRVPVMPGQYQQLRHDLVNLAGVLRMNGLLSEANAVEYAVGLIEQGGREVETLVQAKPDFQFDVRPMSLHFSDANLARFRVFNDDNKILRVAINVKRKE